MNKTQCSAAGGDGDLQKVRHVYWKMKMSCTNFMHAYIQCTGNSNSILPLFAKHQLLSFSLQAKIKAVFLLDP